jgi:hypothetical protein
MKQGGDKAASAQFIGANPPGLRSDVRRFPLDSLKSGSRSGVAQCGPHPDQNARNKRAGICSLDSSKLRRLATAVRHAQLLGLVRT